VVIDFTTPDEVMENITMRAQRKILWGTTGWYGKIPEVRRIVEESGIGLFMLPIFQSVCNLFFEICKDAARRSVWIIRERF